MNLQNFINYGSIRSRGYFHCFLHKFNIPFLFNINDYVTYVQGQISDTNQREYFYFIDHQGMLFLDDVRLKNFTSCFKDKKFLEFFFKRIEKNNTGRFSKEFPYLSKCGRERNYIRCDDVPIVFTNLITLDNINWLSYAHVDDLLKIPFNPCKLFINANTGRVYHPAPEKQGGIGLVRSNLAIDLSSYFIFQNGENNYPTHFTWKNEIYKLDKEWYKDKTILLKNFN
ncbi:UPF0598 protein CG30010 [Prorops nasuta]|uniref:UPF0598 protein CG30010 n=1 Tax=Prorops nasuta TaxID=863751 RepID=UPI0034CF8117